MRKTHAHFLLHGTILTDIEETVAGIKRQHNILTQMGIDTRKAYGYMVLEPLKTLRKDGVRRVARALGLPAEITRRMPFPGPALAARIVGEVTEDKLRPSSRGPATQNPVKREPNVQRDHNSCSQRARGSRCH